MERTAIGARSALPGGWRSPVPPPPTSERGSAPAEFAMVAGLLVITVLAVVQLALALYVRTTVLDAASEGARQASLADATPDAGARRTDELLTAALGAGYPRHVAGGIETVGGRRLAVVRVQAPLPVVGLLGPDRALEVAGHAALEQG